MNMLKRYMAFMKWPHKDLDSLHYTSHTKPPTNRSVSDIETVPRRTTCVLPRASAAESHAFRYNHQPADRYEYWHRSFGSDCATVWMFEDSCFDSSNKQDSCLFFKATRLALGYIQLPIQWTLGFLPQEVRRPGLKADCSASLVSTLKISGASPTICVHGAYRDNFSFT
jgi:hypothetical protein